MQLTAKLLPIFLLSAESALAAGFYLPNQDALATAKGNAFVATADTAAAVHYNPAGLTQLTADDAIIGVYTIQLGNKAIIEGASYEPTSEWQFAPHVYFARPINEKLAVGFGINAPFGLGNDWGQDTPFRTKITEARLNHPSAILALAYEINRDFSIGGSVSLNYADLRLEQGLGFAPGDYLRFDGDGLSVSAAVSARWQPQEEHAFGFQVSSGTSVELRGDLESSSLPNDSATLDFRTPMRVAVGYSYRPSANWNIEANIEWLDWDSLNSLDLKSPALPPAGVVPIVFNWESNFIYELGITYTSPSGYVLAAGYDYNENAEPDATFLPGVADANRHWFNAGAGKRLEDSFFFLAYQYGYSNRKVTENSANLAGETTNGRYEARHHAFVLSWRYSFQ
jgi:long-chain fatty acid transport protein